MKIFEHCLDLPGHAVAEIWPAFVGLLQFPEKYLNGCDRSRVVERAEDGTVVWLTRTKHFGPAKLQDRVRLVAGESAEIMVEAGPSWPRSVLAVRLEQTVSGGRLRFSYEQDVVRDMASGMYAELRNKAYRQKDEAFVSFLMQELQRRRGGE